MHISNRCETNCRKGLIPFHALFDVHAAIILLFFLRQGSFWMFVALGAPKDTSSVGFCRRKERGMKNLSNTKC